MVWSGLVWSGIQPLIMSWLAAVDRKSTGQANMDGREPLLELACPQASLCWGFPVRIPTL